MVGVRNDRFCTAPSGIRGLRSMSQLLTIAVACGLSVRPCESFVCGGAALSAVMGSGASESARSSLSISSPVSASETRMQILPEGGQSPCNIKVIGVGGGGSNAVKRMMESEIEGVDFWSLNTDVQALGRVYGARTMTIGNTITRGLGAGGVPDIGRRAADESRQQIADIATGTDLIFVTAGMGGGTGSGAAPVVAEVAKEAGALTVGVVTKPFSFEGRRRMAQANQAIAALEQAVDTLIVVNNDQLLKIIPSDTPVEHAFKVADDVLRQGVVGISDIIVKPGLINVDFADVRSVMGGAGTAMMGIGRGHGKNRAEESAQSAISSALLDVPITGAQGIVFNVLGGKDMSLQEINAAAEVIYASVDPNANIIFGALVDESMGDNMAVTVIATGFGGGRNGAGARAEAQNIQRKAPQSAAQQQAQTSASSAASNSYSGQTTSGGSGSVRTPLPSGHGSSDAQAVTPTATGSATAAQRASWAPRGHDDVSLGVGSAASSSSTPEYSAQSDYWGNEPDQGYSSYGDAGRDGGGGQQGYPQQQGGYGGVQGQAGGRVGETGVGYDGYGVYAPQAAPQQPIADSRGYYPGEKGYRADMVPSQAGVGHGQQGQGPHADGSSDLVPDGYGGFVRRLSDPSPPTPRKRGDGGGVIGGFFRKLIGRRSKPRS